jgi:hypothetical protein
MGHKTILLFVGSVFMASNNVFLTPQLGQERCLRFVRATGVSHGSYSKSSEFFSEGLQWVMG